MAEHYWSRVGRQSQVSAASEGGIALFSGKHQQLEKGAKTKNNHLV
jgi:hypothetical protein